MRCPDEEEHRLAARTSTDWDRPRRAAVRDEECWMACKAGKTMWRLLVHRGGN